VPLWEDRADAWHDVAPGVRRRILAHEPGLMMVLYDLQPGTKFAAHAHPHLQAGVVLEGGGTFTIGGVATPLRKGSAYVVPGGVAHELLTAAQGPTVILDVFTPRREEFLSEALEPDRP